ncbi:MULTISPECIES: NADH-quinone oxidoreductase subunit A [Photobacterium]|uniref:NADH-quinone oxidoreductase subunit n=1 Tax=Photobacterium angustum TaxID=661 RepID=A0A2S7VWA9_PHOAN|nr:MULTISPECIES: NADH-quinone oxidoreductase subunit A [Photobacterium]EAR56491.1 NADH dehydrogenase I, A subunit [Photobacterium sp. SKA34]PQJ66382.1 NADH dehydrogenase [Photobacterium angustum]PSV24047.1 NADH-quinone oxidoreductase subunit A [Photobacterium sp. GB-56]PSV32354.1 NADH-quinone oxidoreductase subunit A [Photobacterium sp. GB-72]PSV39876.1 NADH-quinone oxidoreductase subunit A [Photobacterium sp. GB-210]
MSDFNPGIMIGVFSLLVFAVIASILFISKSIGGFGRRFDKEQPFECGLLPSGTTKHNFSISYYLIAVAFLIFELEAAILFAWGVDYWQLGIPGVIAGVTFLVILLLGFIYMIRKGVFQIGVYES